MDVSKGLLPILLARAFGLSLFWRIAAAFCAVLGHDFPIFAHFQGGQGLAATLGALAVLAPVEMVWGMTVYGTLFLITRNSDLSAGVGVGLTVLLMWVFHEPVELVVSSILLIVSVPAKTMLDRPRRARIAGA